MSIMAEIIQIKNSRAKSGGYSGELLEEILKEDECGKVLATIISRKVPRLVVLEQRCSYVEMEESSIRSEADVWRVRSFRKHFL